MLCPRHSWKQEPNQRLLVELNSWWNPEGNEDPNLCHSWEILCLPRQYSVHPTLEQQMNNLNKMSFSVTRYVIYKMFQMETMKHPYLNCPASCNNCKSWNKQTNKTKPRKQDCYCQETWSIKKVPRSPLKTTKSNRSAELESYDQYKNPLYLSALTLNIKRILKESYL